MKKKQPNLNLRKELLKEYIVKLTNNRVVFINDKVIRAEDMNFEISKDSEEVDLVGNVSMKITPYSYNAYNNKKVYSSVDLKIFKNWKQVWRERTMIYSTKEHLKFISELNRVQIEKLITALTPIIDKIDKEIAEIEKEENQAELAERKEITRRLKRNITTKVNFEKLNLRELKQLDNLIKKMK